MIIFLIFAVLFFVCPFTVPTTAEQKVYGVLIAMVFMALYVIFYRAAHGLSSSSKPTGRYKKTISVTEANTTYQWQDGFDGVKIQAFDSNGELIVRRGYDVFDTLLAAQFILNKREYIEQRGGELLFTQAEFDLWHEAYNEKVQDIW